MKIPDNLDYDKMYSSILKKLKAEAESNITEQEQMLAAITPIPTASKPQRPQSTATTVTKPLLIHTNG